MPNVLLADHIATPFGCLIAFLGYLQIFYPTQRCQLRGGAKKPGRCRASVVVVQEVTAAGMMARVFQQPLVLASLTTEETGP